VKHLNLVFVVLVLIATVFFGFYICIKYETAIFSSSGIFYSAKQTSEYWLKSPPANLLSKQNLKECIFLFY